MKKGKGEWSRHLETFFWHAGNPHDVKFEIEKASGCLLSRDAEQQDLLSYAGSSGCAPYSYQVRLRFEAALESRNLYSLLLDATAPRGWASEEEVGESASTAFTYWTRNLQTASAPGKLPDASSEKYRRLVREALELESQQASRTEDPAPIRTLQKAVLVAMRKGASFRTTHHEGGTSIFWDGAQFVREDYGLEESREVYKDDDSMLAYLRTYFDWESRRDTYPHKPPEIDVWKFIQGQLRVPSPPANRRTRVTDHWS